MERKGKMRALIAMSGGVDSSAAAQIMRARGYACVGCTMKLFAPSDLKPAEAPESGTNERAGEHLQAQKNTDPIEEARGVTLRIGIPYHVLHCEKEFREHVILPFIDSYEKGRTPNPCLECNRCLKFGVLFEKMKAFGCDCLVTGHYARVRFDEESGRWLLCKAAHPDKDQSYFLYTLTQEELAHVQFPMGDITKEEARKVAQQAGFGNAERKDSQDICFVPDGDYAGFIEHYSGKRYPPGDFTDKDGKVLGRHKGIIHYTLGQRRGLGIPAAARLYVTGIEPEQNRVILGSNDDLMGRELTVRRVNLIALPGIEGELRCRVKIRSRHREQPATVTQTGEDTLRVVFDEPQRAITPGQAAVLYDEDVVIGGGIIWEK